MSIAEGKLAPMSLERMAVEINYSVTLRHSGRAAQAEEGLQDLLPRMEASVGTDHPAAARVRSLLGRVMLERGDTDAAGTYIENSIEGLTPYWRADALLWLAEVKLAMGKREIAAGLARESLSLRQSMPHYTGWQIAEAEYVLARATGDAALLSAATARFESELPDGHIRRSD